MFLSYLCTVETIIYDHKNIHLTLSGHTHGTQFGIEIPGFIKWSFAQYIYKQWAGLYENAGRFIYVNRGFGYHMYPGRVGIMPEIKIQETIKGVQDKKDIVFDKAIELLNKK